VVIKDAVYKLWIECKNQPRGMAGFLKGVSKEISSAGLGYVSTDSFSLENA